MAIFQVAIWWKLGYPKRKHTVRSLGALIPQIVSLPLNLFAYDSNGLLLELQATPTDLKVLNNSHTETATEIATETMKKAFLAQKAGLKSHAVIRIDAGSGRRCRTASGGQGFRTSASRFVRFRGRRHSQ